MTFMKYPISSQILVGKAAYMVTPLTKQLSHQPKNCASRKIQPWHSGSSSLLVVLVGAKIAMQLHSHAFVGWLRIFYIATHRTEPYPSA